MARFAAELESIAIISDSSLASPFLESPSSYFGHYIQGNAFCEQSQVFLSNMGGVEKCVDKKDLTKANKDVFEPHQGQVYSCTNDGTTEAFGALVCDFTTGVCEFSTVGQNINEAITLKKPCTSSPTNQATSQPTNQPTNQGTEQPTHQGTEQPTNQGTKQPTTRGTSTPTSPSIITPISSSTDSVGSGSGSGGTIVMILMFIGVLCLSLVYFWKRNANSSESSSSSFMNRIRDFKSRHLPVSKHWDNEAIREDGMEISKPRNVKHQAGMTGSGKYLRLKFSMKSLNRVVMRPISSFFSSVSVSAAVTSKNDIESVI